MGAQERWDALGISNPTLLVGRYVELTGNVGVYLSKSVNSGARFDVGKPHGYQVIRPGYKTNLRGPWTENGHKTFSTRRRDWDAAFREAEAWARARYGLGEFGPIPGFGTARFPAEIVAWAKAYLKRAATGEADKE